MCSIKTTHILSIKYLKQVTQEQVVPHELFTVIWCFEKWIFDKLWLVCGQFVIRKRWKSSIHYSLQIICSLLVSGYPSCLLTPRASLYSFQTAPCARGCPGPRRTPVAPGERPIRGAIPLPFPTAPAMLRHWLHPLQTCSDRGLGAGEAWGSSMVQLEEEGTWEELPSSPSPSPPRTESSPSLHPGHEVERVKWLGGFGQLAGSVSPASRCLTGGDTGWTSGAPALLAAAEGVVRSAGQWRVCSFSHLVIIHDYYTQNLLDFFKEALVGNVPFFLHRFSVAKWKKRELRKGERYWKSWNLVFKFLLSPLAQVLARIFDRCTPNSGTDVKKKQENPSKIIKWKLTQ